MLDVICVGSATIDLFVNLKHKFAACVPGEKMLMENLEYLTGGGGSNAAVALSRLFCKVGYLGKVGSGYHALRVLKELKEEKVKIIPVQRSHLHTAFSVVMESSKEKDRIIYVHKGATNELTVHDFDIRKVRAKWLYLASVMGKTLQTAKKIVAHAEKRGMKILFNPSSYLIRRKDVQYFVSRADILVLNRNEAQLLTRTKKNIPELALLLLKKGPSAVIITEGPKGVYYFDKLHKFHVPSLPLEPVSTTGAGDAFTAGFLAGTLRGKIVPTALKIGVANACSVIQQRGAKHTLLTWTEAMKAIENKKLVCTPIVS